MTSIYKKGIIERMREIKPMWRACCLLNEHSPMWAEQLRTRNIKTSILVSDDHKEDFEKMSEEEKSDLLNRVVGMEARFSHNPMVVERKVLIDAYIEKYYKNSSQSDVQKRLRVDSIIDSCINKGFVEKEKKDNKVNISRIILTTEGYGFSDWFGLQRERVVSLGVLASAGILSVGLTIIISIIEHTTGLLSYLIGLFV